jgi:hypothetical protein
MFEKNKNVQVWVRWEDTSYNTEMTDAAKSISEKFEAMEYLINEHHDIYKECGSFYTDCGMPVLSSI